MKATTLKTELVERIGMMQIYRSECKRLDELNNPYGKLMIFYDVCDNEDLLGSFKRLKAAKKFAQESFEGRKYEDAFFLSDDKHLTWIYFNPDSAAGGQYVLNELSFNGVKEAAENTVDAEEFFDYLGSIANQSLADIGSDLYNEYEELFYQTPDFTDCTKETMEKIKSIFFGKNIENT